MYTRPTLFSARISSLCTLFIVSLAAFVHTMTPPRCETVGRTAAVSSIGRARGTQMVSHLGGAAQAVALQGDYAYVASRGELTILDISSPTEPIRSAHLRVSGNDIAVHGSYIYVAGQQGLHIVDARVPSQAEIVSLVPTGHVATGVALAPGRAADLGPSLAYVVDHLGGLSILDISDPHAPVRRSYTDIDGVLWDVGVLDGRVYIGSNRGLYTYDVSDSAAPRAIGLDATVGHVYSLALPDTAQDHYVFLGTGTGLHTVTVGRAGAVTTVDHIGSNEIVWDVSVEENRVFVAMGTRGIGVVDISMREEARMVGSVYVAGIALGLAAAGERVYVAAGDRGVRVVDVSVPEAPWEAGHYAAPGFAWGMDVDDRYAYLAAGWDGNLHIVDMADPLAPKEVGFAYTQGEALDVDVRGVHTYIADGSLGLSIMDVSNPAQPSRAGHVQTPGYAIGVAVNEDASQAVVAADSAGLRIIDVSDVSAPLEIGAYEPGDAVQDVALAGRYAYVAMGVQGLHVIDMVNPRHPQRVATVEGRAARRITIHGSFAYIAAGADGLYVLDILLPHAPVTVAALNTPGKVEDVAVADGIAYVAASKSGVIVLDMGDPTNPVEIGSLPTADVATALAVIPGHILVAERAAGLAILENDMNDSSSAGALLELVDCLREVFKRLGFVVWPVEMPSKTKLKTGFQ